MFKYRMSVIVPVYNCEDYIEKCVESLKKQTMPTAHFQIILVNDGSTDNSGAICEAVAKRNENTIYISKENGGVSSARNAGIEVAEGKYLIFLDADDSLTIDTLSKIYDFFERNYDKTDLVTYKIVPYNENRVFPLHYRFTFLKESGVYDLNETPYCYTAQSTMNICVKNRGKGNNILFDTTLRFHEDQKYCFTTLSEKLTIGFCQGPEYRYFRRATSATGARNKAYFIFEDTISMWEELFGWYKDGNVPKYLQSFYLHDLNWKSLADILLPYHYDKADFECAVNRLVALIKKVDDDTILYSPSLNIYYKTYLIKLKRSDSLKLELHDGEAALMFNGEPFYTEKSITAVINHFSVRNDRISIDGFLKSPILSYCGKPELYIVEDGNKKKLELTHSEHEHFRGGIKVATFWRFKVDVDIKNTSSFFFETVVNGIKYENSFFFGPFAHFTKQKRLNTYFIGNICIKEHKGVFKVIKNIKKLQHLPLRIAATLYNAVYYARINPRIIYNRMLALNYKRNKPTWLYLDRYGVFDNAYDQFKHDFPKKDGVKRYYILNDCDRDKLEERFTPEEQKNIVMFHSKLHKHLYFNCDKIITSFSNLSNVSPFGAGPMKWYSDLSKYELVYLQHGILHATLKNLYDKERCPIDRVVVSSGFEIENFQKNYGFEDRELIKSCMPRYDSMEPSGKKKNRIVFSPSWRSNLIGALVNNERKELPEVFMESAFFKQVSAFLNSERLHDMLEKNDLYLDFKNHPIFKCYNHLFDIKNDRVCTDNFDTNMDEYRLMITDYSSIVFDSVYLNCPVLYFVPDYELFLAGVSHNYRQLDLPLENGFGPFSQDADTLLDHLEEYINNGFAPQEPYASRMKDFFLYRDDHCCDRLYDAMIND